MRLLASRAYLFAIFDDFRYPHAMHNHKSNANPSIEGYISGLPSHRQRADCVALLTMFREITGVPGKMGSGDIADFGEYAAVDPGTGVDHPVAKFGFAPRKESLTLYLTHALAGDGDLLEKLGKHKLGPACLYLKHLGLIDAEVLAELITRNAARAKKAGLSWA